ncbi:VanW family protein [Bacillus sp. FJAT-27225]|uniref:VanW family protein n=1 Tax=Bacillus sp. FJAT-27225 TaxID=1743144 RepID=UPI000980F78E|nr:VanW family protein [Bacillus sp. FJAT-27225]
MLKLTKGVSVLLICSFIGLAGCTDGVEVSKQPKKVNAVDRKAEQKPEAPVKEPVKQPTVIYIKDPAKSYAIHAFIPEEMGYGKNNDEYKKNLEKWARELAAGTEGKPGYDKRGTLDRIGPDGQIIKGEQRVILEEAELVESVLKASATGGDVVLPVITNANSYAAEDAAQLNEVLVASYTTYFDSSVAGRTKNIELSAKAINNLIVGVGDHFSFNTEVGPSDEAHGYQPAKEIVNKKLVMGIGGGICQTSSTLFNAVDQLGVDYVEWHHHSLNVGYVPQGRDATVSYGGLDFRFLNTSGAPFLVKTVMKKGALTVEIRTANKFKDAIKKRV